MKNKALWLDGLNQEQSQSAIAKGNICVVARAGTGKTKALIARVIHQIFEYKINPSKIILLSFTNKAVGEINNRLKQFNCPIPIYTGTFHSVAYKLMKKYEILFADRDINSIILDSHDSVNLIKNNVINSFTKEQENILTELVGFGKIPSIKKMAQNLDSTISILKTCLITPDILKNGDKTKFPRIVLKALDENSITNFLVYEFYQKYEDELKRTNSLDYNDLINIPLSVLESNDKIREIISANFKSIIVDEHQDTNISQIRFLNAISKYSELYTVGDDGQSIYGWRGASVGFIRTRLQEENIIPFALFKNYRSNEKILELATMILEYDKDVTSVKIQAAGENALLENTPILRVYDNFWEEVRGIIQNVINSSKKTKKLSDNAILCRTKRHITILSNELSKKNIPFISDEWNLWSNKDIKFITSILSIAEKLSNNGSIYISNILQGPIKCGIGEKGLKNIIETIDNNGVIYTLKQVKSKNQNLKILTNIIKNVNIMISSNVPIYNIAKYIYEETGLKNIINENLYNRKQIFDKMSMQNPLYSKVQEEYYSEISRLSRIEQDFLEDICKNSTFEEFKTQSTINNKSKSKEDDYDGIKIMTIHSAKGLEFENVFIFNCTEDTMNTHDEQDIDFGEACRLLYVAITRAKKELMIFTSNNSIDGKYTPICHLLEDIPNNLLKI